MKEDKIILGARKSYLFKQYATSQPNLTPEVIQFVEEAVAKAVQKLEKKIQEEKEREEKLMKEDKTKDAAEAVAKVHTSSSLFDILKFICI
jgi:hypothetical protein